MVVRVSWPLAHTFETALTCVTGVTSSFRRDGSWKTLSPPPVWGGRGLSGGPGMSGQDVGPRPFGIGR